MYDVCASIVCYKSDRIKLLNAINSFLNSDLNIKLVLIDNSPIDDLKDVVKDSRVEYIFNPSNPGFGTAHNIAIKKYSGKSKYYLVLNPDVYFEKGVIESLFEFMNKNFDVGHVMPKVLYPDGSIQYLCKLIPSPLDSIFRRFNPFKKIVERRNYLYEMRFSNYDEIMEVPYLSGCFMFIRSTVFNEVGCFDEQFFMYPEDIDLTRRINEKYKTIFYPMACIYHEFEKGSHKNFRLLRIHIISMIKYFNKWGWIFDDKRKITNKRILANFNLKNGK
jgi:GT2 family glycosyltransferase